MKKIVLFGAGKSATTLINYLLQHAENENWHLIVADFNLQLAQQKTRGNKHATAIGLDMNDTEARNLLIADADLVISMLPPTLHILLAKACVTLKKNLLTASYIDDELLQLKYEIEKNNLFFLCEAGLDPGIDHMSAMQLLDRIRDENGTITSFKSHCGGLIVPEDDNNPWHYKISWNPRNVVLAGKAGAVYKEDGTIKELNYQQVFENCPTISIPTMDAFACYPNRNSLAYIPIYKLEQAATFVRCTLRRPDFCIAWNYIVRTGLTTATDESIISNFSNKTINDWFTACLNFYTKSETFDDFLKRYVPLNEQRTVVTLFTYLGLMSNDTIPLTANTSADILQYLLEKHLALNASDRDMIIMIHEIEYQINNLLKKIFSSLIVKGEDALNTAMAKTVGLPLAIAARLILNGTLTTKGLHIPILKEIYEPILAELGQNGIHFYEEEE